MKGKELWVQLDYWGSECRKCAEHHNYSCETGCPHQERCGQAYEQIMALIKKPQVTDEWIIQQAENTASDYPDVAFPNLITIFKGLLKEAGYQIGASVTEKWIDDKSRLLSDIIQVFVLEAAGELKANADSIKVAGDFIRKLVEEMPAKKAAVSEDFVEKWYSTIMELATGDYPELGSDDLEQMFTEAGLEVVE